MEALFGKTLNELTALAIETGLPKFTGKQLAEWLYQKDITSIDEMTNLSKKSRELLSSKYEFGLINSTKVQESIDELKSIFSQPQKENLLKQP